MKNIIECCSLILCLSLQSINGFSQEDITKLISENVQETNTLVKSYATPLLHAIGNGYNQGWHTTADPLKPFRFELKVVATASMAPVKDQSFNLNDLNLTVFKPSAGAGTIYPTIIGKDGEMQKLDMVLKNGSTIVSQQTIEVKPLPFPVPAFPVATPQLSIGLPKGTELMGRYLPPQNINLDGDGKPLKSEFFGFGIKHDIKQWIPVVRSLPFSLSAIAGYTKANITIDGPFINASDVAGGYNLPVQPAPDPANPDFSKQQVAFTTEGWMAGGLISKKFAILTFHGGVILNNYKTSIGLKGPYPVLKYANNQPTMANVSNPVLFDVNKTQVSINGGLRLKLLILNIGVSGNYVPGGYSSATVSLGLGYFN